MFVSYFTVLTGVSQIGILALSIVAIILGLGLGLGLDLQRCRNKGNVTEYYDPSHPG